MQPFFDIHVPVAFPLATEVIKWREKTVKKSEAPDTQWHWDTSYTTKPYTIWQMKGLDNTVQTRSDWVYREEVNYKWEKKSLESL